MNVLKEETLTIKTVDSVEIEAEEEVDTMTEARTKIVDSKTVIMIVETVDLVETEDLVEIVAVEVASKNVTITIVTEEDTTKEMIMMNLIF